MTRSIDSTCWLLPGVGFLTGSKLGVTKTQEPNLLTRAAVIVWGRCWRLDSHMHLLILDWVNHSQTPWTTPVAKAAGRAGPRAVLPQAHTPAPLVSQKATPGVNPTVAHNQASPTDFSLSSPSDPGNSSPGGDWVVAVREGLSEWQGSPGRLCTSLFEVTGLVFSGRGLSYLCCFPEKLSFLFIKDLFSFVFFFHVPANFTLLFYECTLNNFTGNNRCKSSILRKYFSRRK